MEIKDLYDIFLQSAGVCTDTRTLKKNQLFFALKGENFDGNRFALQALEKGASYAVAGEDLQADDPRLIKVPDTLETLKALAAYHRRQLCIPVIGLTGTNGKTTTKELIKTALGAAYRVSATEGNLNNEIGVPLTVLKIGPRAQLAIVEMGASHPEDLKPLLAVAQPNLGLITNVGKAHLLGFGSYEGVKHAKGLLYDYLKEHDGVVFANAEDPVLQEMLSQRGLEAITYSREGVTVKADPFVELDFEDAVLKTHLVGAYNAANILAALKLAWYFDVPREDALQAIASYIPSNNRSQLVKTEKNISTDLPKETGDLIADTKAYLDRLFAAMELEATVDVKMEEEEDVLSIDVEGPDMGVLIGKRGQTLDALQYLISLYVNKKSKDKYIRVKLDTENYRARRKETLENLAKNIAFKVKRSRRSFTLEPMNPYERRIIHSTLQNDRFVATRSEGEEPYRKVVVYLKKKDNYSNNRYENEGANA